MYILLYNIQYTVLYQKRSKICTAIFQIITKCVFVQVVLKNQVKIWLLLFDFLVLFFIFLFDIIGFDLTIFAIQK